MDISGLQELLDQHRTLEREIVTLEERRDALKKEVTDLDLLANLPTHRAEIAGKSRDAEAKSREADRKMDAATTKLAEAEGILSRETAKAEAAKEKLIAEGEEQKKADIAEGLRERARFAAEGQEERERMIRHAREEAKAAHKEEVARWEAVEPKIAGFLKALETVSPPRR